jgi:hypothetical protein
MGAADRRIGLAAEVINNIKVIKFFAWVSDINFAQSSVDRYSNQEEILQIGLCFGLKESKFLQKMQVLREAELTMLFKRLLVTIGESAVSLSVPIIVSIVTFYTHTKVFGKSLTAEEAFTALALFNVFKFPLNVLVDVGPMSYILNWPVQITDLIGIAVHYKDNFWGLAILRIFEANRKLLE